MSQAVSLLSLTAAAADSIAAHRAVAFNKKQHANTAVPMFGVSTRDVVTGENFVLTVEGTAVCEAGGAIAANDAVMVSTNGTFVKHDSSATKMVVGYALEAAADGATFEMIIRQHKHA
ncbi:MAG: DUF2190 family protein [Alphaproteobacteria bacterium]|nr:DUF2190 family protein [Alphaproteobacteria bacterium]